jgi:hypothetical protein
VSSERIRVAVLRDGKVETVMVAPSSATESIEAWGLWCAAFLAGPYVGCEMRALRDPDEAHVAPGYTVAGASWAAPVASRDERVEAINAETDAKIAGGFEYKGQRFSLSERSQITISNAYTIRASLPYPLDWANADDSGFVTLASQADMAEFYTAATTAVLLARTAGNAKKKALAVP